MKYTGSLPSIHLKPNKLYDLERILQKNGKEVNTRFELKSGEFIHEYSTVEEMLDNTLINDFIQTFDITVECAEGTLTLSTDGSSGNTGMELRVEGEEDWTRNKRDEIGAFFATHGSSLRTRLTKQSDIVMFGGAALVGLFAQYVPSSGADPLLAGIASFFVISILINRPLDYFYPYSLLILDSTEVFRPTFSKAAKFLAFLAAAITILIGVIKYM